MERKAACQRSGDNGDVDEILEELARKGVQQISQKKYTEELRRAGVEKIVRLGVAFYKKNCKVVCCEK